MLTAEFPGKLNLISCLLQSTGLYFGMWTAAALHGHGEEHCVRVRGRSRRACAQRSALCRTRAEEDVARIPVRNKSGLRTLFWPPSLYPIASTFVFPDYSL